jgi:ribosomal-protein-alanine N-acetyltransferase
MILRGYDLDAMHALDIVCFERPFRFSRSAMRRFAEAKKARVVIAEAENALAGFCIVHMEQAEHGRAAYIVTLDVAPEQRRKGIARALLLQAEARSTEAGCTMMALHVFTGNPSAIRFYESVGFLRSHTVAGFYGEGIDALAYHKALAASPALALR